MIVHEWGHLRWGVFDEYENDVWRLFYPSSSGTGTEATACSVNLAKEVCGGHSLLVFGCSKRVVAMQLDCVAVVYL